MKMRNIHASRVGRLLIGAVLPMALLGCTGGRSSAGPSPLSHGLITSTVVEGQTTQAEVAAAFGGPNVAHRTENGECVWIYERLSSSSTGSSSGAWFVIGAASSSRSHSATRSITFVVTFDKAGVVKSYSVRESQY
jgi:hypothetical protein